RSVAASDDVLALLDEAPPRSHQPNVLLAAVHYLLLGGLAHPLAAVYAGSSDAEPGPLFVDICLTHRDEILELLATRHTNTNEVGRSAVIAPALTAVARRAAAQSPRQPSLISATSTASTAARGAHPAGAPRASSPGAPPAAAPRRSHPTCRRSSSASASTGMPSTSPTPTRRAGSSHSSFRTP